MIRARRGPISRRESNPPVPLLAPSARQGVAALAVVVAAMLFFGQETVRIAEARVAAAVLTVVRVAGAQAFGTNVLFRVRGAFAGVNITTSCSVALLLSPFCLLAGGLLLSRRTSVGTGLRTLGVVALWLIAVNQARILIIILAMRIWGLDRGYELSHVAFGSGVSTLGVLGGVALFVRSMARAQVPAELSA